MCVIYTRRETRIHCQRSVEADSPSFAWKGHTKRAANGRLIFPGEGLTPLWRSVAASYREKKRKKISRKRLLPVVGTRKKSLRSSEVKDGSGEELRNSWCIVRPSLTAISYFAFRCYSKIVANCAVQWTVPFLCNSLRSSSIHPSCHSFSLPSKEMFY